MRGNDRLFGDSMPSSDDLYNPLPFDPNETGEDIIRGGSYHDLVDGGPGKDQMFGGKSSDTVSLLTSPSPVTSDPSTGVVTGETTEQFFDFENFEGSRFADVLQGWPGRWVGGNPGDDTLTGTSSGESLDGGAGDDVVEGNGGHDSLYGDYSIIGHGGLDHLAGGDGHDMIEGDLGADELLGGAGDDFLEASVHAGVDQGKDIPDLIIDGDTDTDRCYLDADDPVSLNCESVTRY
jgi:serralysin